MLKVETTHLKEGWLRRNGLPRCEKATMTEYFLRHGEYLNGGHHRQGSGVPDGAAGTHLELDTEPGIRAHSGYIVSAPPRSAGIEQTCVASHEFDRPAGWVPHHLPGRNRHPCQFLLILPIRG